MRRTTIRSLAFPFARRHHLSTTAAADAPGLGKSINSASDFARRHGTLATILGGVLSATVLTAVAVTHKDTELARTRGELGKELAAKDAVLAHTREELGIALARTREELGKELARTRGELDKELAAKDAVLARTCEELGIALARAREELVEVKGRVRAGGGDSAAP
jgi:hypothetical protein